MTVSCFFAILEKTPTIKRFSMHAPDESPRKRETLNIRIKPEERSLIDRAAKMRHKNRTDFILEAVKLAAEEALLEQAVFMADPEAYAEFIKKLDMPPSPNKQLRKTMQTPAPWDEKE